VANALNIKLGMVAEKPPTESVEAYQLYMRGNLHSRRLIRTEVEKGIGYYQDALKLDPKFALAYVDMANAYRALVLTSDYPPNEYMPKAREAAERAIEIDNTLAEAYAVRAFVAFWYEWDWKAAEDRYRRAIELNPNSAESHMQYGHLLSNLARHDEAIQELKKARELDPAGLIVNALEGQVLFYAGRTEEADRALSQTLDLDPNFWLAHLFMSRVHLKNRDYDGAIASAGRAAELSSGNSEALATVGNALARAGRTDEARKILSELEQQARTRFVPAYSLAIAYAGLGDREKTLDYLERAFGERDAPIVFLKIEPKWDELRSEPRFIDLMKRMNFN
jgi:tetratricopeptide (TPR) repeat protein